MFFRASEIVSENKIDLQPVRIKITSQGIEAALAAAQTDGTLREIILEASGIEISDSSVEDIAKIICGMPVVEVNFTNCKIQNLNNIVKALASSSSILKINFSDTQFNADQIKFLLKSFSSHATLTSLNLTNTFNIITRAKEKIPEPIEQKEEKKEVAPAKKKLSFWTGFKKEVKRQMIYVDYKSQLEKNNELSRQFYEIFDFFEKILSTNKALTSLNISNNIPESPRNGIADRCMRRFFNGLKANTTLITLICNSNDICGETMGHLFENNPHLFLKNLMLASNAFSTQDVKKIFKTLELPTCPIEVLDLSNGMSVTGSGILYPLVVPYLKDALVKNPASHLREIDLHNDVKVVDEALDTVGIKTAKAFALALKDNKTLQSMKIDYECPELKDLLDRNKNSENDNAPALNQSRLRMA